MRRIITFYFKWFNNFLKTCGCGSCCAYKKIEEEVNSPLRNVLEREPTKKGPNVSNFEIS
jgi:hypothetical protein